MFNFRKFAVFSVVTALAVMQLTAGTVFADSADKGDKKVTICHATGSSTNPYVRETVSVNAAYNAHIEHQDYEDIIPPFTLKGKQYSQNWDANGMAIWNNGCKTPKPVDNTPDDDDPQEEPKDEDQVTPCQTTTDDDCMPGGMGSGPTDPTDDPQDPATTPVATTPQLANTGSGIWISSLISLAIIAISTALGFMSRRKLAVA